MKTIGLLLSDSLMKACSIAARRLLIKNYGLSELNVRCFPGKTTDQLIGGNDELLEPLKKAKGGRKKETAKNIRENLKNYFND